MPNKLTDAQKKAYIDGGGNTCPYCGSGDVEGGERESDADWTTCAVECHNCGCSWTDVYKLADVVED